MEADEIEIVCVSNNVGTQTGNDVQTDDNRSPDPILVSMFNNLYTVLVLFASGLNLPVPTMSDLATWLQEIYTVPNQAPSVPAEQSPASSNVPSASRISLSSPTTAGQPSASSISFTSSTHAKPTISCSSSPPAQTSSSAEPSSSLMSTSKSVNAEIMSDQISYIAQSDPKVYVERVAVVKLPVIPCRSSSLQREAKAQENNLRLSSAATKKGSVTTQNCSRTIGKGSKTATPVKPNQKKGSISQGKRSFFSVDQVGSDGPKPTKKVKQVSKTALLEELIDMLLVEQDNADSEEESD